MNKQERDTPVLLVLVLFMVITAVAVNGLVNKIHDINNLDEVLESEVTVKTRRELLTARPGDIIEFKEECDKRMLRVNLNPHDPDAEAVTDVRLYVAGMYSCSPVVVVRVSPWQVKGVYHHPSHEWEEATQRFVLQDLPDIRSR